MRTRSSSERSHSCGRSSHSWLTSGAGSGIPPNSIPLATSNPPTATPTIGPSTPLASTSMSPSSPESNTSDDHIEDTGQVFPDWDCTLHLPLWVPETEKAAIEDRLEGWTEQLEASGADIASLALFIKKPLRPLWISQKTVIWLNEVPEYNSWDFTPIILVSASSSSGNFQHRTTSEFSWSYIPGAGDDEESWARGLSPNLFWNHAYDLINLGPDLCNQKVADIVEKDRVYRAQRGQNAPQLSVKPSKLSESSGHVSFEEPKMDFEIPGIKSNAKSFSDNCTIFWLGSTNLAVGATQLEVKMKEDLKVLVIHNFTCVILEESPSYCTSVKGKRIVCFVLTTHLHLLPTSRQCALIAFLHYHFASKPMIGNLRAQFHTSPYNSPCVWAADVSDVDCILNCDKDSVSVCLGNPEAYLHLPIVNSKLDRFSLLRNLPSALNFAKTNLRRGKKLLVCCNNGEDISICVSLAILTSLFTDEGFFDDGNSFGQMCITKLEMRKRLVFLCKFAINARPSRGNLKQVFNFLNGGSINSVS